jgi:3-methyladenine DNA glycosylase AlkD
VKPTAAYVAAVEAVLTPHGNTDRAAAMAAYMKDNVPFLGIPSPARRAAVKPLPKPDPAHVHGVVRALWTRREREYQYVALDLLAAMAKKLDAPSTLSLLEELAQQKSWWDSVDGCAGLEQFPLDVSLFAHRGIP